jgi:glucose-6-phosphate 1-dehydrogenase
MQFDMIGLRKMGGDMSCRLMKAGLGWRIAQPVLSAWAAPAADVPNYASGGAGPAVVEALIGRGGERAWRPIASGPKHKPKS